MNTSFDIAVIGTSPVLLIEAICQSNQNKNVLIIERRSRIGGGWYTKTLWDTIHVEVGCHYIERAPQAYSFLRDTLGIKLQEEPRHIIWQNTNYDQRMKNLQLRALQKLRYFPHEFITGRIFSRNFWNLILGFKHRDIQELRRSVTDLLRLRQYYYPVGGCRTLLDTLSNRIKASNISVFMETSVQKICSAGDKSTELVLGDGRSVSVDKVITGQQPHIDIYIEDKKINIPRHNNTNFHVIYHVKGKKTSQFGYLDIFKNSYVRRVSDISHHANCKDSLQSSGELLICCHVQRDLFESNYSPMQLFDYLKDTLKLLTPGSILLEHHIEKYHSDSYIDRQMRLHLENTLPSSIELLYTYDFGKAIERYCETRWRTIQKYNQYGFERGMLK